MNRTDFLNMMHGNAVVNRQLVGEVYELIDIFPYFHSAHLLLLKGLQTNGDVKFENQLRNSALYIADREVLYNLLSSQNDSVSVEEKSITDNQNASIQDTDHQQTVIETAKNSEQLISEIENDSEDSGNLRNSSDHDTPQPTYLSESFSEEQEGIIIVMDEDENTAEEKIFYMDPGITIPEIADLLELDTDEETVFTSDQNTEKNEVVAADVSTESKKIQADLIDKFIIANPRIEPIRDKTLIPQNDISTPFVESEGGFVTETLAGIYINQGYYSKAIEIYEKLSLKFPEKSSYFASQIEKVKEYLKK